MLTNISVLVLYLIFHRLAVVSVSFFSLIKGIILKNLMLCFVLINSVFLTFYVFGSFLCLDLRVIYVGDFICIILGWFSMCWIRIYQRNFVQINYTQVIVHFYTQHTSWWSEGKSVRKEAGIEFVMKPFVPLSL